MNDVRESQLYNFVEQRFSSSKLSLYLKVYYLCGQNKQIYKERIHYEGAVNTNSPFNNKPGRYNLEKVNSVKCCYNDADIHLS